MKNISITKKTAIIAGVIVLSLTGGVGVSMANKTKAGADPTWPIVTEVDQQKDKLANHEARITNLEGDTKDLRNRTAANSSKPAGVTVPTVRDTTVTSNNANSGSAFTPVVTSYREIPLDEDTSDCEYAYSDGTTYRFKWKTTNLQGSWMTDGNGQNGKWLKAVTRAGACDDSAIGLPKN